MSRAVVGVIPARRSRPDARRWFLVPILASLAFAGTGCAVFLSGTDREGGSGSLSDAAAQARSDSTTRHKVPPPDVGYTVPPAPVTVDDDDDDAELTVEAGSGVGDPGSGTAGAGTQVLVGVVAGAGMLGGADRDQFGTGGVQVGWYPQPRLRIDAAFTINGLGAAPQSFRGEGFRDPRELSLDLTGRYYLTPDKTFLGVYGLAGLGTGTMFWDYGSPVTVTEDGRPRELDSDRINYFSFFGGAGLSLIQTRVVHVGGNLTGGVRFYGWHTGSGLENDLLKTTGTLKGLIEITFRVR